MHLKSYWQVCRKLPYLTMMILCMGESRSTNWSQWNKCRHPVTAWRRVGQHHVRQYITTTHRRADQQRSFNCQCFKQRCEKMIFLFLTQLDIFAFSPTCTAHTFLVPVRETHYLDWYIKHTIYHSASIYLFFNCAESRKQLKSHIFDNSKQE